MTDLTVRRALLVALAAVAAGMVVFSGGASAVSGSDPVTRVAGRGCSTRCTDSGDGGPATKAGIFELTSSAADSRGNVYVGEWAEVRRIGPDGRIRPFWSIGPNNGQVLIKTPLAVDAHGNVYVEGQILDKSSYPFTMGVAVFRISPDGKRTVIAGSAVRRSSRDPLASGDGVPATSARLLGPTAFSVDPRGNLFMAEGTSIREVTTDGIIRTVAGHLTQGVNDGSVNDSGDGGPATKALFNATMFNSAKSIAVDRQGNIYVLGNHRLRKIDHHTDTITTIAGIGEVRPLPRHGCFNRLPAPGPARKVGLLWPTSVAVDRADNVYFTEGYYHAIFRINKGSTTIRWVAGHPWPCTFGPAKKLLAGQLVKNGTPSRSAFLQADAVDVDANGDLFLVDGNMKVVYKIANSLPVASFTASKKAALTVSLDASGSHDKDGSVASYAWDFGDGTTGAGKTVSHTYPHAGSYTVKLTVADDKGALSRPATKTITVSG